ncbi:MAG: OprO/OprP family phosphate-selective porin [Planctomycetaceae bacterium]|jgi:phosphate-selective porin OprO/OprP|nr:OprO/OprP family phosphate-selective porin [Planctomycetaceae bacterium]
MKNFWLIYLEGILAAFLFFNGISLGDEISAETEPSQSVPKTQASLTPRQKGKPKNTLLLAQQPPPPATLEAVTRSPLPPPPLALPSDAVSPSLPELPKLPLSPPIPVTQPLDTAPSIPSDPFVYSELDRLTADIEKLKKETKKPDTKKTWSTPKLSGRLFLDSYTVDEDAETVNRLKNKAGIREMQFAITGNGFESFDYKIELSLAPSEGQVNLVDNWVGINNVPFLGYVRAGHFKPETGFAYPTSALHTSLTEFAGTSGTFGFGRRVGVSSEHLFAQDHIRLFYGVFQGGQTNTNRFISDDNPGTVFNIHLTAVPIYENEGRQVLHFGGHWSYVHSGNNQTSLSIQPGSNSWYSSLLGTGNFGNNHHHRAGLELAFQNGPISFATEWYFARYADYVSKAHVYSPDRTATGGYIELGYFLTNDHRSYQLKSGTFGAAKVKHNFHPFKFGEWNLIDGFGAWQLILQWSYLDLLDWRNAQGNGGRQNDLIFGVNWFWTSNIRWIVEYVHSQQNIGSSYRSRNEDIFGTSLRLHF